MDSIVKKLFENRRFKESSAEGSTLSFDDIEKELYDIEDELEDITYDMKRADDDRAEELLEKVEALSDRVSKLSSDAEGSENISEEEWRYIDKKVTKLYNLIEDVKSMEIGSELPPSRRDPYSELGINRSEFY